MVKFFLLAFLTLSLPALGQKYPASNDAVVSVNARCSGFIAAKDVVVTAAHCLVNPTKPQKVTFSDFTFELFYVKAFGLSGHQSDWAILVGGSTGEREPMEIAQEEPTRLSRVIHFRFVEGEGQQYVSPGLWLGPYCEAEIGCMREVVYQIAPGDSGGPILDYYTGKVVGITSLSYSYIPLGLAVPVSEFRDLLPVPVTEQESD